MYSQSDNFSQSGNNPPLEPVFSKGEKKPSFHTLSSILTFILLPHFLCFSIPALIFSSEAEKFYKKGDMELSAYFSRKAKRFVVSSWLLTVIIAAAVSAFAVLIYFS